MVDLRVNKNKTSTPYTYGCPIHVWVSNMDMEYLIRIWEVHVGIHIWDAPYASTHMCHNIFKGR